MAVDIQDFTQAVNILGGSVSITGTATVVISGTPNVAISGTPTVILGGGSASVGSISAIGSTVTVAGTINIGNTPAVTISGTPSVTISSGSVNISGGTIAVTNTGPTSVFIQPFVPTVTVAQFFGGLASGGTSTIIAAVAGKVVTIWKITALVTHQAFNGSVQLRTTPGNVVFKTIMGDTMLAQDIDLHGQVFPSSQGIQLNNTSGAGITLSVMIEYTQV
jgi:hypothetical protein